MFRRNARGAGAADRDAAPGVIRGAVRADRRTKQLIGRLQPGEVALIDHEDLDRLAAESLIERRVRAVLNVAASSSGRYPNLGPLVLAAAGVPLVDGVSPDLFDLVHEGDVLEIEDGRVLYQGAVIAKGEPLTMEVVQARLDASKRTIGAALERFAENTIEYIRAEREYLLDAINLPDVRTDVAGRHVLVVVRGYGYKKDLAALRAGYIPDFRPVLIGVDGGADALLERRLKPDMIIGDFDSVTAGALDVAKDLIHHVHPNGHNPGFEELQAFGVDYEEFVVEGTSEDAAMILAHEAGADLIVAVGTHATMIEFLDKGRPGMASTFLTRLRLGPTLVDAKGVSRLYEGRVRRRDIVLLFAAAIAVILVMVAVSDSLRVFLDAVKLYFEDLFS